MRPPRRKIMFVTGTRADFGKLKTLIAAIDESPDYECFVFATGMHTQGLYGYTVNEVEKAGFANIFPYVNQSTGEPMDLIVANTVQGLSHFVDQYTPDLIVVHGDRVETLAGAIVGALKNVLVAHIEGGEVSGTVDELIRHSVSKLSHLHFVANEEAARRLRQMGEKPESVFVIGSPDIDVMISDSLPTLEQAKAYYTIAFDDYAIAIFHPVTTELDQLPDHASNFVGALTESGDNYVVIYPNNDSGSAAILKEYKPLRSNKKFRIFPSLRFEHFLTLLKHAAYIVGNSSAGIREAPFYGRPTVNVGSRQSNRFIHTSIFNAAPEKAAILAEIGKAKATRNLPQSKHFGRGDSLKRFLDVLRGEAIWKIPRQKQFVDIEHPSGESR